MGQTWCFLDYVDDDGENQIKPWLDSLPKAAKVKINAVLRRLEVRELLGEPEMKQLKGACDGLLEVRVRDSRVQYRPLGCYGPGNHEVTLLIGAVEKGNKFEPRTACAIALTRKYAIQGGEHVRDHDFR